MNDRTHDTRVGTAKGGALLRYYLQNPEELQHYKKKRGGAWLSLSREERNAIILAERFAFFGEGRPGFMSGAGVYFVQEPTTGAIKIGIARDMTQRMIVLQTSHPYKLKLLG